MAAKSPLSYWLLPVASGLVWLVLLIAFLSYWTLVFDSQRFPSMEQRQSIPYISDIGAFRLKPLFISLASLTVLLLDAAFISERYLRHKGRLIPNASLVEKLLSAMSILFALIGTIALIMLTILDTYRHEAVHETCLLVFIPAYLLSATCLCGEYWKLGTNHPRYRLLRLSFYLKLFFVVVVLALGIVFASTFNTKKDLSAVSEWIIAFLFTFYNLSFAIDLWPAVHTRNRVDRYPKEKRDCSTPLEHSVQSGHIV